MSGTGLPFGLPLIMAMPSAFMEDMDLRNGKRLAWAKSHTCPCTQQGAAAGGYMLPGGAYETCNTCGGLGVYWDAFSAPFIGMVGFGGFLPMPNEPGSSVNEKWGQIQNAGPLVTIYNAENPTAWSQCSLFDQIAEVDSPSRYNTVLKVGTNEALPLVNGLSVASTGAVTLWNATTQTVSVASSYVVNGSLVQLDPSVYPQGTPYTVEFYADLTYVIYRQSGGLPHSRQFGGGTINYPKRFTTELLDLWLRQRNAQNPPNWSPTGGGASYFAGS